MKIIVLRGVIVIYNTNSHDHPTKNFMVLVGRMNVSSLRMKASKTIPTGLVLALAIAVSVFRIWAAVYRFNTVKFTTVN